MDREHSIPDMVAASTQPALIAVRVQSPARKRLEKPECHGFLRRRFHFGGDRT